MPRQSQRSLGPMKLEKCSGEAVVRTKDSDDESFRTKDSPDPYTIKASEVFHASLDKADITSAEAAHLIGVSESLLNRMRSVNYRESASLPQLFRLPASFWWQFVKQIVKRFNFGKTAVGEAVEALGVVAAIGE